MRQRDEAEAANADLDEANAQLEGKLEAAWAQRDEAEAKIAKVRRELDGLDAWARDELITDDGFTASCVQNAVSGLRRILDGES